MRDSLHQSRPLLCALHSDGDDDEDDGEEDCGVNPKNVGGN